MMEFVNGKDDIPYMKWKLIHVFETTNQNIIIPGLKQSKKICKGPRAPGLVGQRSPWPPLYPGACGISCIWIFSAGRSCKASDRWQGGVRVCQPRKIIWVCLKIGYPRNKSDMFIPFFQDFPHQNCHFLHPISRQSHLQRAPHLSPWESGSGRPMT